MRCRWIICSLSILLASFLVLTVHVLVIAQQYQASGWHVVGQVGGSIPAVAVQGNYAYVGVGLRLVALNASTGPAKLANIVLHLTFLMLPVVRTSFVWTKISTLGKLLHLSPSGSFAHVYSISYQPQEGDYPLLEEIIFNWGLLIAIVRLPVP